VLVVSHDRYFLDRVATSILAFEPDGRVIRYPGNYSTYLSLRPAPMIARPKSEAPPAKKAPETPRGPKPLTHAERKELDGIMDEIAASETRVTTLERALSDPTLYTTRGEEAKRLNGELDAARAEVAALTSRWEWLESRASIRRA
jgi:ATP-binding cassette subfamily F protein uup